jgi:hypothetical protein
MTPATTNVSCLQARSNGRIVRLFRYDGLIGQGAKSSLEFMPRLGGPGLLQQFKVGPDSARTGLPTSVTGRPLKILKRSLKHCLEIEFQSKERIVLNRRLRYILGDEIHHRTQDAASVV